MTTVRIFNDTQKANLGEVSVVGELFVDAGVYVPYLHPMNDGDTLVLYPSDPRRSNYTEAGEKIVSFTADVAIIKQPAAHLVVTGYTTAADNTKLEFQDRYA